MSCSRSLLKIGNKIFHLRLLKLAAGSSTPFRGAVPAAVGCTPRPGPPPAGRTPAPSWPAAPVPYLPPRKFFPFSCLFASSFQLFGCFGQHAQMAFNQAFPDDVFFPFFFPFSFKPCKKGAAPCWFLMPCCVLWTSRSWGDAACWLQGAMVPTGLLIAPALGPAGAHPAFGAGRGRATTRCYFQERGLLWGLVLQGQQEDNLPS